MLIQHCIPISAVNQLLLCYAFTDENHMLNEALYLRHADHRHLLPLPSHSAQMTQRARRVVEEAWHDDQDQFIFLCAGSALTEHSL